MMILKRIRPPEMKQSDHANQKKSLTLNSQITNVTPVQYVKGVGPARARLLARPYPAATGLICEALLRPEMQIEVDPFAVLD